MLALGDTFLDNAAGSHLYVVITAPDSAGKFVAVNFTSIRGRPREDMSCEIAAGEHPFVTHPTCVNYSDAITTDNGKVSQAVRGGLISTREPVSPDLLRRIQEGALVSLRTPRNIKVLVKVELEFY